MGNIHAGTLIKFTKRLTVKCEFWHPTFVLYCTCSIFCYGCTLAFVVLHLVFQCLAKRLLGKNVSEII